MAKKQKTDDAAPTPVSRDPDPITTETTAACARGLGQIIRGMERHHLMGPGVRVEVLDRDHLVISAPDPDDPSKNKHVRHVRISAE